MLTDTERELIAAAVDGDLTTDQEVAFRALMAVNPAAGILFAQLQADCHRLRDLPRRTAPLGLADKIVARIVAQPRSTPSSPCTPQSARPRVSWAPYVVAASLLLAVTAASFWVSFQERTDDANRIARKQRLPRTHGQEERQAQLPVVPTERMAELGPVPREVLPKSPDSRLAVLPQPIELMPEVAPIPRPFGIGDVVGSRPLGSIPPFESVEARLPVLATVNELERKEVLEKITAELNKDPAFRLDLFTKDVIRAAASFQAAARSAGLTITVEAATQDRIHKKVPTVLAIYTDSLTPTEVTKLLSVLSKNDRADKAGAVFTTAHLVPAQSAEHREVRELLGLDIATGKRKIGTPKQPVTGTAGEMDKAASPAIMLTYLPAVLRVNPTTSKDIKAYLDRRPERKTSAITLLVVIRPAF